MSIEAMKQALDFIEETNKSSSFWMVPASRLNQTVNALRQAIEQADKKEPVAWVEPEFWSYLERSNCGTAYRLPDGARQPLYTTPQPQREWVGLTDEEIQTIVNKVASEYQTSDTFARAIEAKLKEKNT